MKDLTLYVPDVDSQEYERTLQEAKCWQRATPGAPVVLVFDARHVDEDCYSVQPFDHPFAESLRSWMQGEQGHDEGWGERW